MTLNDVAAKNLFRERARVRRAAITDREVQSSLICNRLTASAYWAAAQAISLYVDFRDEVQTRAAIQTGLSQGKTIAVPWCRPDTSLDLYAIHSLEELQVGKFGILEPPLDLRKESGRRLEPATVDLIVIPGLAFDRTGGRMGYGRGHYDRLIPQLSPACLRVGLAFDEQIVDWVPTEPHDAAMHLVITPQLVLTGDSQMDAIG
jgi:5-formyltetrahydrofolate cyclo-ligase